MDVIDRVTEMKLTNIFMPYAAKCREDIVARDGRFVHYTSADNAIKIIQSKRLWMRNAKCMSDYMEVSHGYDLLVKFFSDQKHKGAFYKALEPFGNEIAQKAIESFNQWWNEIQYNTFISSISEHNPNEDVHGRLSMWRAYGQPSAKAAIVIKVPFEPYNATKSLHLWLRPVAYFGDGDVERELTEVITNINTNLSFLRSRGNEVITAYIFIMFVMAAVSLKHEGFKEEKEWRVIYLPGLNRSKLMSRSIETINGVPQTVYKIPLEDNPAENVVGISIPQLVQHVILGPSEYALPLYEAFKVALEEAGVENAGSRVVVSGIPLRT